MKRLMIAVLCVFALSAASAGAAPLDLVYNDLYYLGAIVPNTPSDPGSEVEYINYLTGMTPGSWEEDAVGSNDLYRSLNSWPTYPPAAFVYKDEVVLDNVIDASGIAYVLAKYGGQGGVFGAYVWYNPSGFTGEVRVPASAGAGATGTGLSHISLYTRQSVPDGGMTLMLLGGALVGLASLRRRF